MVVPIPATFRELIDMWPSRASFAEDHDVNRKTADLWAHRDTIPATHWTLTVDGARRRAISRIDYDLLVKLEKSRRQHRVH